MARIVRSVVIATAMVSAAGVARAQPPKAGDIVVVDWQSGRARVLRIDSQTGQRSLVTDLTTHGPAGTWPAAPHARGIAARSPSTLYVIVQTEEFDPTDPFAATNGINCYPFPFPKQTCGAVLAVDGQTGARTMLADFGDLTQADPSLPTSRALGAWPIAAVVESNDLLVVDKDSPTTFGINNPRFGALWRVVTSGPNAGLRSVVTDFADSTKGPFGADPFAIAQDASGRVLVVDRAAFASGIKNCNPDPTSPPVGCGVVFQIDPDGTRHLITDLGDGLEGQISQADSALAIAVTPDGRIFVLSQTGGGLGCVFGSTNGSCAALFELIPDPIDPYRHSRRLFSDFGNAGQGPTDAGVFGLAVGADGKLLITGCAGAPAHGSVPSICTINPLDSTGQRTVLSDFGDLSQQPGLPNTSVPVPLGIAVVPPEGPATTTALTASPNPSTYGQTVTLTATVTSASGTPTGQVAFSDGGSTLATVTLAGGTATTTTAALAAGSHTLGANYPGDSGFNPSTGTTTLVVNHASTTVALASSLNPAPPGQTVTFTATVTPQYGGTPTGTITFREGATILGTSVMAGSAASFDTNALAMGSHSLTATYEGDANFTAATSPVFVQLIGDTVDLAVSIVSNPIRPPYLGNFTLVVDLRNDGTVLSTGARVQIALSSGVSFVSADPAAEFDAATRTWTPGSLAVGATRELRMTATMTGFSAGATARIVAADQPDLNTGNNVASVPLQPLGVIMVNDSCSLRQAIVAANTDAPFGGCPAGRPGLDTIILPAGSTQEYADVYENLPTVGANALPSITSPITIEGQGSIVGRYLLVGPPQFRIFYVRKGGALTLHQVTVRSGNTSGDGGGVLLEGAGATAVIDASQLVGNTAAGYGGGISSGPDGDITIRDSVIAGNASGTSGGGVDAGGALIMSNTTIGPSTVKGTVYGGNTATIFGGGVYTVGVATVSGGSIQGNAAADGGGLINGSVATLTSISISGNRGINGMGGIDNRGKMTIDQSIISDNTTNGPAGGIYNLFGGPGEAGAGLVITNSTISGNLAGGSGGGLVSEGPLTLTNTTVGGATDAAGNVAGGAGGGVLVRNGGSLVMTGGAVSHNLTNGVWTSDGGGGGIANGSSSVPGTVTLNGVVLEANRAPNGTGGGIFNRGPLAMNNGTLRLNAALSGGGLSNGTDGLPGGVGVTLTGVVIAGNGAIVRGGGFENDSGTVTMSGGAINFNTASQGGGLSDLHFDATPVSAVELRDGVVVSDNVASGAGGGVLVGGGSVFTMTGGSILRNVANGSWDTFGGGGGLANGSGLAGFGSLFAGGTATLTDVLVANNRAPINGEGGGIFNRGTLTVTRGVMTGNAAGGPVAGSGGAIGNGSGAFSGGTVTLTGVTLSSNTAFVYGGAISSRGPLTVNGGAITGNAAEAGGAIGNLHEGSATLANVRLDSNSSSGSGGHVFTASTASLIVDGGSLTNGRAVTGGGIFTEGALTVRNGTTVSDNTANGPDGGGGAYVKGTSPILFSNATLSRNHAPNGGGGAIHASGATNVSVRNSSLLNNDAGEGAAMIADGAPTGTSLSLVASTLNGNQSSNLFSTSALKVLAGSNALISNTTVTGNSANEGYLIANYGTTRIASSTIVDNTAAFNVFSAGDVLSLVNTVVAGNHIDPRFGVNWLDCYPGGIVSNGYNLFGQNTGCPLTATDIVVDPAALFTKVLAPLADNGGPTLTHALLPGSPALDAANPFTVGPLSCDPTDQRGLPRPKDGDGDGVAGCDIGAFEQQTPLPGPLLPTSFSPTLAVRGGPAFTLTVKGTAFTVGSVVLWNGAARPTTFVSTKQIQAAIPASDLATAGDVTAVLIGVARPDGATSNVQVNSPYFWVIDATVAGPVFIPIDPGSSKTITNAAQGLPGGAVTATMTNNGAGTRQAVVEVATYASNPVPGSVFSAGGFFDVQIIGADSTDTAALSFYYPAAITGAAETALQLLYWTGSTWAPVVGSGGAAPVKSTADNLDGTISGGRFSLTVDGTSTPRITDLTGTIFATVVLPQAPQVALQNVLADLRALRKATTNRNDGLRLDAAIQSLTLALDAHLWRDATHLQPPPTGAGVYVALAGAIVPLHAILGDPRSSIPAATARSYIDRILDVGRRLALIAIGDAQAAGGNPQAISLALHEISAGDAAVVQNQFEVAMADDGLAWGNAELALRGPI